MFCRDFNTMPLVKYLSEKFSSLYIFIAFIKTKSQLSIKSF